MAENIDVNVAFTDSGLEGVISDTRGLQKQLELLNKQTAESNKILTDGFAGLGKGIKSVKDEVGGLAGGFGAAFDTIKKQLAGISVAALALEAVKVADAFNLMQASLKRVSGGDADVAKAKFGELSKIADELGLKNSELVATYTNLAQRGFKPTGDEIKKLIDIAKASNKEVNQLAEAILDAQTGEFERLKEFGIKAKVSGDQVSFSFNGVTKTVKNSADEINKAILSFGDLASIQGAAAGAANTLTAAQNRLSNAVDSLLQNIGQSGTSVFSSFVGEVGSVVGAINDTLFPTQALNREFDEQRILVAGLDKDLPKLTERYKQLSSQKSLNKKEQAELNKVTEDIIKLVPLAAEGFGKYSDGLRVNLDALNKYSTAQKEVYKVLAENEAFLTRGRLTEIKERKAQLEKEQEFITKNDNLFLGKRSQKGINDAFKKQKAEFNAITLEEIELNKKNIDIQEQLERLSKGQTIQLKKNTEERKKNAKDELTDAEKKKLEQLRKSALAEVDKLRADAAKANLKNISETNEELVTNQRDLDLKLLAEEQKALEDKIRIARLKINVEKEFGDKTLAIIEDSIVKIRAAREKDLETGFGIGKTVTKLKEPKEIIDTAGAFQIDENKTLADAIINPKGFNKKFKELNKITKEEVDKLNAEIRRLVPKNADLNAIIDPLERLKLKILAALGIDDQQAQTIVDQLSKLGSAYLSFFNAKNEASAKAHEEEAKRIDAELALKNKALDVELQRQKDGSANNVDAVKNEIKALEQERRTALDKAAADREKNQKAQLISDGIVQASNLITSITDIYKGFAKIPIVGLLLGAAAVGGFLLLIAAAKDKARASVKLRHGGLLKGDLSHENGGIQIADQYEAESGEFVLNKEVTRKNLPFVEAFNKGKLSHIDFNSLVGNNAVTDSVQRARASQDLADSYNKSIIYMGIVDAINSQTEKLINHDKSKVQIVPNNEGYIEIKENQTGGKNMKFVKLSR